jgi:hypothetical protein
MTAAVTQRLAAAHTKVSETQAAVAAAVKALQAAQTFLDNIEREIAKHVKRNQELAVARAAKLMAALKLGSSPAPQSLAWRLIMSPGSRPSIVVMPQR